MTDLICGMPYEDLIETLDECGLDYEWAMDHLMVQGTDGKWVEVRFVEGAVDSWEDL